MNNNNNTLHTVQWVYFAKHFIYEDTYKKQDCIHL